MEKQRISTYLDSDLVRRADAYHGQVDCHSRNEFITPEEIKDFRREAVNNVRRTRGKVRLDDLFYRRDEDSL
ncbi:MAG: hypothetical protein FWC27_13515 [Firmicutes bacterium]|nr:hypothetical protein [Bacillota bacterium]